MLVCIAGGSGFIGRNISDYLVKSGYGITLISRSDLLNGNLEDKIEKCNVLINLIGEPITGIWTIKRKDIIYRSRVENTRKLVHAVNQFGKNLQLIIGVSGVAIYDDVHVHDEKSKDFSKGFLGRVIVDWEKEYECIARRNIRVCILRLGVVLGKSGGFFKKVDSIFKRKLGFVVISMKGFSFIHLDDLVRVFQFVIVNPEMEGIINATSPEFISISDFFEAWVQLRECFIVVNVVESWTRLVWGEAADILVEGQTVMPQKLLNAGFVFKRSNARHSILDLM